MGLKLLVRCLFKRFFILMVALFSLNFLILGFINLIASERARLLHVSRARKSPGLRSLPRLWKYLLDGLDLPLVDLTMVFFLLFVNLLQLFELINFSETFLKLVAILKLPDCASLAPKNSRLKVLWVFVVANADINGCFIFVEELNARWEFF